MLDNVILIEESSYVQRLLGNVPGLIKLRVSKGRTFKIFYYAVDKYERWFVSLQTTVLKKALRQIKLKTLRCSMVKNLFHI